MTSETLPEDASVFDAVRIIEESNKRLAVVLSPEGKVVGTLTDGDVRRSLLGGERLQSPIRTAMNTSPIVAKVGMSDDVIRNLLKQNNIRALPIVKSSGEYIRTLHESELLDNDNLQSLEGKFVAAVIMAGGEGSRLRPLTNNIPKPMVTVNGFPILERQIRRLKKMNISDIIITVNFESQVITDYFGDGSKFGVNIRYIEENQKLGTAGSLSLLPQMPAPATIVVMNGDVLTSSDFSNLYAFHTENDSRLTISAVDYHVQIPYGVIENSGANVLAVHEKPSERFFCNAGIYAISVEILNKIPRNSKFDMTELIEHCLSDGEKVCVFPVHEYWTDIGSHSDLEEAQRKYSLENK